MVRKISLAAVLAIAMILPSTSMAFTWMNSQVDFNYGSSGQLWLGANKVEGGANLYWGPFKGYNSQNANASTRIGDFYCIDLAGRWAGGWKPWTVLATNAPGAMSMGGDQGTAFGLGWAANLYNTYALGIKEGGGTATKRAALQLAIWEALYDGAAGYAYDLSSTGGGFHTSLSGNNAILTQANAYLAEAKGQGVAMKWHDGQDLMGEVPEPGSLLLVGTALLDSRVWLGGGVGSHPSAS